MPLAVRRSLVGRPPVARGQGVASVERALLRVTPGAEDDDLGEQEEEEEEEEMLPMRLDSKPPSAGEDERELLLHRLWSRNEVIKQLKHVVETQHAKIEELREKLDIANSGPLRQLASTPEAARNEALAEENQELRLTIARLKSEGAGQKKETLTLRRANKRLKAMLQCQRTDVDGDDLSGKDLVKELIEQPLPLPQISTERPSARSAPPALQDIESCASPSSKGGAGKDLQTPVPPFTPRRVGASPPRPLPSCSRQRLLNSIPLFWRDITSAPRILSSMFEVAERTLSSTGVRGSFTIYLVDDWLKGVCAQDESIDSLAQFYEEKGKTSVLAFSYPKGTRAEAPTFSDVHSLPIQTLGTVAYAIQMPGSHRRVAAFQATRVLDAKPAQDGSPTMPKVLMKTGLTASSGDRPEAVASQPSRGFSDWQRMALELACHVLGGVLEQHEVQVLQSSALKQAQGCMKVAVTIAKAPSLKDLEMQATTLLAKFFKVNRARLFFYNAEAEELFITSPTIRRKGFQKATINEGIVGLCARRRQLVRVSDVLTHPYFSCTADLQQSSSDKRIKKNTVMLCGPLLLDPDRGEQQLLGVMQLLDRPKHGGSVDPPDFTEEEEMLFEQLLQICSHVLWRAFKVEEAAAKISGQPSDLEQLLVG